MLITSLCASTLDDTHSTVAALVAERLRAPFLNHLIISPLCLVWVRAPLWPLETSQVLLAGVSGGFYRAFHVS